MPKLRSSQAWGHCRHAHACIITFRVIWSFTDNNAQQLQCVSSESETFSWLHKMQLMPQRKQKTRLRSLRMTSKWNQPHMISGSHHTTRPGIATQDTTSSTDASVLRRRVRLTLNVHCIRKHIEPSARWNGCTPGMSSVMQAHGLASISCCLLSQDGKTSGLLLSAAMLEGWSKNGSFSIDAAIHNTQLYVMCCITH